MHLPIETPKAVVGGDQGVHEQYMLDGIGGVIEACERIYYTFRR
jgi:hypothetical protein